MTDIDMRTFARGAGVSMSFQPGSAVFHKGEAASCMYVIQSGVIEMVIGETVVDVCGPNQAIGYLSLIDGSTRSVTARVKEPVEVSVIDQRKFRFMVDEVPNFAHYIMDAMARRIRGLGSVI